MKELAIMKGSNHILMKTTKTDGVTDKLKYLIKMKNNSNHEKYLFEYGESNYRDIILC